MANQGIAMARDPSCCLEPITIRRPTRLPTVKITKDGITSQHIAEMSLCCEVIPSFVIFAVFYV